LSSGAGWVPFGSKVGIRLVAFSRNRFLDTVFKQDSGEFRQTQLVIVK
jgi:hypothetical protein